jgi:hypothetical protein
MPMPFGLPPPDPGFEMLVASHGMSQGLSQTDGIQVFPRASVRLGAVQVGGQWRNITSPSASGVAAFFVKVRHRFGQTELELGGAYRLKTGAPATRDNRAWEYSALLRRRVGRFGFRALAEYSPREFDAGRSLYVDTGASLDLKRGASLSANLGRRERDGAPDYTSFNLGLSQVVGQKLVLDARGYWTDHASLGHRYVARLVLSARLSL